MSKHNCPDWGHPDLDHHMCLHCGSKSDCIDEEDEQRAEEQWTSFFGFDDDDDLTGEGVNNYDGAGRKCG